MQHVVKGDRVVCSCNSEYGDELTEGKEYEVVQYVPAEQSDLPNFRWPAYLVVLGDDGKPVRSHAARFRPRLCKVLE